jgi:hypothetical protein
MAKYDNIINEFEVVAEAFTSVNYFVYNRVSSVNGRLKDKDYPMILVNSTPNYVRGDSNNGFLPRGKRFTFNIFCYGAYPKKEREVKDLQTKQGEIDNILDQYIAELINRNIEGDNGFSIVDNTSLSGFLAHDVHNDDLVQSTYTMTVDLDSDCIEGTFNY